MRSRVQTITPEKATQILEANTSNRPLSRQTVRTFADAMRRGAARRGEWIVTHQGVAFDIHGFLVGGQHRLAAVVEADIPVELTVFTEVPEGTFDVLDTGKRRNAADVLAIEGEKNSTLLAAMVRTVWLFENRQDLSWAGGSAAVTNHQIVHTLEEHPKLRDAIATADQIASATGMIKSAAGAASYLITQTNKRADLAPRFDGIVEGTGLEKGDPRLAFPASHVQPRPQTSRPATAAPRYPRTCRPVPQGLQRLGQRRTPTARPPLHPPRGHAHRRENLDAHGYPSGERNAQAPDRTMRPGPASSDRGRRAVERPIIQMVSVERAPRRGLGCRRANPPLSPDRMGNDENVICPPALAQGR